MVAAKKTMVRKKNSPVVRQTIKKRTVKASFKSVEKFLKAIADTNRLRILQTVGDKTLSVTEIYRKLRLPQNLTSHHISRLKSIGILVEKKEGTFRFYSVNRERMLEYGEAFKQFFNL